MSSIASIFDHFVQAEAMCNVGDSRKFCEAVSRWNFANLSKCFAQ